MTNGAPSAASKIAIVTPTKDRRELLERLYSSLREQTDRDFLWIVVDDASEDETPAWVESIEPSAPFEVLLVTNEQNKGKCLSLNAAFSARRAGWYLVVDSDDTLLTDGVSKVRQKIDQYESDAGVGALFFSYKNQRGESLGGPPGNKDLRSTRPDFDVNYGKYDGSVAYSHEVTSRWNYPGFEGETYLGPTVLQYMMSPQYSMVFTTEAIGVAEYQENGLTQRGRELRLNNPLGMMYYSKLHAEKGASTAMRLKGRIGYWAYMAEALESGVGEIPDELALRGTLLEQMMGRLLRSRWRRFGDSR